MAVVDLSKFLEQVRNRVYLVGLELEGGWTTVPREQALTKDTSVKGLKDTDGKPLYVGELVSDPMFPAAVSKYLKDSHPSHVNQSCGLHVHMSFEDSRHYMRLMDSEDYQDTMIAELVKWGGEQGLPVGHPLWSRLAGLLVYCQKKFWPEAQVRMRHKDYDKDRVGHRYTMIHYCHGRKGTIECRVLPMMDSISQSISAVMRVIHVTNAYLVATAKRDPQILVEVVAKDSISWTENMEVLI